MADASFDAVVVGGGQQGLVVSNYLALNGMTVGLFEQRHELGGCATADPSPAPGFIGNPHAEHLGFWNSPCNTKGLQAPRKGAKLYLRGNRTKDPRGWTRRRNAEERPKTRLRLCNCNHGNGPSGLTAALA
ncbi:MAG: NAD(P)-binding protein [Dehalococcoidia bacterium]